MKVKELKPILEHLDENAEIEFSIVSQQETPKNELRDNYRTCGDFTFGYKKVLEDPDGLLFECWPIYGPFGLVGYLRKTGIGTFYSQSLSGTIGTGKYWKRVSIYMGELLKAIGEFVCKEYDRDEFHVLFTQEGERFVIEEGLNDGEKKLVHSYSVGIVPLVYFEK